MSKVLLSQSHQILFTFKVCNFIVDTLYSECEIYSAFTYRGVRCQRLCHVSWRSRFGERASEDGLVAPFVVQVELGAEVGDLLLDAEELLVGVLAFRRRVCVDE